MSKLETVGRPGQHWLSADHPAAIVPILRGVGQVFFQENALTGALFLVGIALSSPLMAAGALAGAVIGTITAKALGFDAAEVRAGIYGFNSVLVGMATLFFFGATGTSVGLLVAGCVVAAPLTRLARLLVPFPTYTAPFIVITWSIFFLGQSLGLTPVDPGGPLVEGFLAATAKGIGQVMFQGCVWTGVVFLVGIAVNDREHAAWVVAASVVGMLVGLYHNDTAEEVAALGLYGYNATLAAVALFLWRRSLIAPLMGILFSVPFTEYFPMTGLPTLTAPFVLAAWLVLLLGWFEGAFFGAVGASTAPPSPRPPRRERRRGRKSR